MEALLKEEEAMKTSLEANKTYLPILKQAIGMCRIRIAELNTIIKNAETNNYTIIMTELESLGIEPKWVCFQALQRSRENNPELLGEKTDPRSSNANIINKSSHEGSSVYPPKNDQLPATPEGASRAQ
jgi:hypothetical protein